MTMMRRRGGGVCVLVPEPGGQVGATQLQFGGRNVLQQHRERLADHGEYLIRPLLAAGENDHGEYRLSLTVFRASQIKAMN